MKKGLLFIVVLICMLACKKEGTPKVNSGLFGKWELAWVSGGLRPSVRVTNSGNMYQFNNDSTYVKYLDNKVVASGKFSIRIIETQDTVKFGTVTLTNPDYHDAWAETPNTITIGTSAFDGPSYEYHRVK
jgi:hypothetical protein